MMTCCEFTEFLPDYRSGDLDGSVHDAFERHVIDCARCAQYLRGYIGTIRLAKAALRDSDEPREIPESLVETILGARGKS